LHDIPSPPSSFLSYLIKPYSSEGKKWDMWCQWPWPQQRHESTTSQLVVGHADPAFRDLGENAMKEIIGAPKEGRPLLRKTKNDASKALGERTKKQRDTPGALPVGYKEHEEQPLSEMSHTHRNFFGFVAPIRSATTS
jgi:hypothetical protein